jgi:hypothetical protein
MPSSGQVFGTHVPPPAGWNVGLERRPPAFAVDADNVGAHVREQHAAERARPNAGKLNDLNA